MASPVSQRVGVWYRFAVFLLKPFLTLVSRREWTGQEHLPRTGGVVVCTNHVSYLDPLTFAHFLWDQGRPVRYLAKDSVFRIPVLGRLIAACGQIRVHRESEDAARALEAAVAAVHAGECVGVYPEGTLTRDPGLWPMTGKTGAARIALATGCPVVPIAQWGVQDVLAPYGRRLHVWPRRTVHARAGAPVDLEDLRGLPVTPEVLVTATERIMAAITAELEALRGEPAPVTRFDPRVAGVPRTGNPHRRRKGQVES